MYLVPTVTAVTEALKATFTTGYPEADFTSVNVTIDFPMQQQNYPAIWVQFAETGDLERAGIDHRETWVRSDLSTTTINRYIFEGDFSFTVAALSSLERDRLYDQLVRVLALNGANDLPANAFRSAIENSDLVDLTFDYDVVTPSNADANPGTPWATNEVIYEKTLTIHCIGTFVSDTTTGQLISLSKVLYQGYDSDHEVAPDFPDAPQTPPSTNPWSPTDWH